jgi:hypothetical protein
MVRKDMKNAILRSLADFDKPKEATERLAIINSLIGILPSFITDKEIKEERMKRYAR